MQTVTHEEHFKKYRECIGLYFSGTVLNKPGTITHITCTFLCCLHYTKGCMISIKNIKKTQN